MAADALPTVQIDGVVWSQAIVGNTVYAGGSFANARPAGAAPGANTTTRNNLLAYNITTGVMSTSFVPNLNGQVLSVAASPDGSRIYVGGDFTTANGVNRYRLAAYSTATGALITTFAPVLNARVQRDRRYQHHRVRRRCIYHRQRRLALAPGRIQRDRWIAAQLGAACRRRCQRHGDGPGGTKLIVGGQFANLNGSSEYGMGALDAATGANLPWAADSVVKDGGANAAIDTLSTDGTNIYGGGYVFGSRRQPRGHFAADPATGNISGSRTATATRTRPTRRAQPCTPSATRTTATTSRAASRRPTRGRSTGRSRSRTAVAGTLLHNTQSGYADFGGQPAPKQLDWYPTIDAGTYTGQNQAAWNVTGNGQYVVEGGEFPTVNGVGQQGLVRFAV